MSKIELSRRRDPVDPVDTVITGDRATPHPDGIAWNQLIGVSVTVGDHAGVVLPGVAGDRPELLRLTLFGSGEVVHFDPAWFTVDPMPDQVHIPPPGSRRRTHCPDGRYIYRGGELPAEVLATETMLKHLRRRRPEGLEPIATYLGGQGGNSYHPLYAVADCAAMPPQTPKQQAAWTLARTCAWCGATNMYPYTRSWEFGGLRLCGKCSMAGRADKNLADRNAKRMQAIAHARVLLADPTTVVATHQVTHDREDGRGWSASHHHVEVVDHQGKPLGQFGYTRFWDSGHGRAFDADACAQLDALRAVLTGKWVLEPDEGSLRGGWTVANDLNHDQNRNPWFNARPYRDDRPEGWSGHLGGNLHWIISDSRVLLTQLPRPPLGSAYPPDWHQREERHLHDWAVGGELPTSRALMWWQILNAVAHDPHPAGPAVCPRRASHLAPPCGSTELIQFGFCAEHSPEVAS